MLLVQKPDPKISPAFKPEIVFANLTINYYDLKYRELAKTKPAIVKKEHMKSFTAKQEVCTIMSVPDNIVFPDRARHDTAVTRAWKSYNGKDKKWEGQYMAWVSKIEIIKSLGKVN